MIEAFLIGCVLITQIILAPFLWAIHICVVLPLRLLRRLSHP